MADKNDWFNFSNLLSFGLPKVKAAVTELKNLNRILTEISATSDLTQEQLADLGNSAFEKANKLGVTASDYLKAVKEMSRYGFHGTAGESIAELSLLTQSAGDLSSDLAKQYVLAASAACQLNGETDKLNEVLDGQNAITNKNNVSMENMALAMNSISSAVSDYSISIKDLSAMIGTLEAVTGLPGNEVSNGIISTLSSLQNASSSDIVKTLNKAGVSLTEFSNGAKQLRDPISIIRDLATAFQNLNEADPFRAEILTTVGGENYTAQLEALLTNMELFDKMLMDYSQGTGSIIADAVKTADSWEGSLNQLSNTWTNFIANLTDTELLSGSIDVLNGLLESVTQLSSVIGPLGTVSIIGSGLLGAKGSGLTTYSLKS